MLRRTMTFKVPLQFVCVEDNETSNHFKMTLCQPLFKFRIQEQVLKLEYSFNLRPRLNNRQLRKMHYCLCVEDFDCNQLSALYHPQSLSETKRQIT